MVDSKYKKESVSEHTHTHTHYIYIMEEGYYIALLT